MKKTVPLGAVLIPEHATKVFTGQIFDVYQWPQKRFDGSSATFEMLKRPDTVQVLAVKDGKVVLVHDEQPGRPVQLHLPGGRVDHTDASWLDAAQRELREETGLSFKNWKMITVRQPLIKIEWFVVCFVATDLESEVPQHLDPGERITREAMRYDQLRELAADPHNIMMEYASKLLATYPTLEDLLAAESFTGQEIDR